MVQTLTDFVALSQQLLLAVRTDRDAGAFVRELAAADESALAAALPTDAERNAFWINVYNAFTQLSLRQTPEKYRDRSGFYKEKRVIVAGKKLSLDDIEHGVLRRSKLVISLGYLTRWLVGRFERRFRVAVPDARVHFALNCGAQSCPPIRFYEPARVEDQLELATESYLSQTVDYRPETNEVWLPRLFLWFGGDFGGQREIRRFLRERTLIPADIRPILRHHPYDWTLRLDNFS